MWTLHGLVFNHVFPLVYCLTTRKTQITYTTIFSHLSAHATELGLVLNPSRLVCDFELAVINSVSEVLPDTQIGCCLFHYTQCILRHAVIVCGLKTAINSDYSVKLAVNYLMALPFIPLPDLATVFRNLTQSLEAPEEYIEQLQRLYTYAKTTFVSGVSARGRRRAQPPRYAPDTWNVFDATVNGMARTNNFVESWHARFAQLIVTHHANVWKFLDHLKLDQDDNESVIIQLARGHTVVRHRIPAKYRQNQQVIETVVGNYNAYKNSGTIKTYLEAISYRLKRPNCEQVAGEMFEDDEEEEE